MNINPDDLLNSILDSLSQMEHIRPEQIPDIDLYMDQVTTFMDSHLAEARRYPDDKILTKTMINNYAKNNLLPPPAKKKYSKEHMLLLIFIYYFKSFLSISDIQTLLSPLTERYFKEDSDFSIEEVYREVLRLEDTQLEGLLDNIRQSFHTAAQTFDDAPGEDREFLKLFSFICMLSFDVYMKKQLIEKLIDAAFTEKK